VLVLTARGNNKRTSGNKGAVVCSHSQAASWGNSNYLPFAFIMRSLMCVVRAKTPTSYSSDKTYAVRRYGCQTVV